MLVNFFIIFLLMLLSTAFFTIMERKLLGSFHFRLGPNKTGMWGIFQPMADGLKLFSKNLNFLSKINEIILLSPILLFLLLMTIMNFFPIKMENSKILMNFLTLILMIIFSSFLILKLSFFSSSKYSIISSKRVITQVLSYEMGLMFILIFFLPISMKLNTEEIMLFIYDLKVTKFMICVFFFILVLMETSRTPFDFLESESELISGFNTEFSSSYFSLFFIFEYCMMLFFSILISCFSFFFLFLIFIYLFIIIRSSFPRFRYDHVMIFMWKYIYMILLSLILYMKFL